MVIWVVFNLLEINWIYINVLFEFDEMLIDGLLILFGRLEWIVFIFEEIFVNVNCGLVFNFILIVVVEVFGLFDEVI